MFIPFAPPFVEKHLSHAEQLDFGTRLPSIIALAGKEPNKDGNTLKCRLPAVLCLTKSLRELVALVRVNCEIITGK